MNVVESIVKRGEFLTVARLQCGHEVTFASDAPHIQIGGKARCPECDHIDCRRTGPQRCSEEQIAAVAAHYAETMRALGFDVPEGNMPVLRRAAAIQDAWRLAFATVLGK